MPPTIPDSNMPDKDAFIFDLDGTLAESKAPISDDMAEALASLLSIKKVCIVSGGNFEQFKIQVIDRIEKINPTAILTNLYIQPTSGARMCTFQNGQWKEVYATYLADDEKKHILSALDQVVSENKFATPDKLYGEQVEDRGSQITFSALGQHAPVLEKKAWDPDLSKKKLLTESLRKLLPGFEVRAGGLTSIDIVKDGLDKAYGIRKLSDYTNLPISRMCFVGDAIYEDGNDYPAVSTGIDCISVENPEFTLKMLGGWLRR